MDCMMGLICDAIHTGAGHAIGRLIAAGLRQDGMG